MAAVRSRSGESHRVAGPGQRWGSGRGVWWAIGALLIEAFVAMPGCLNPRPEELPSASSGPGASDANRSSLPERESCADNPLLASCSEVPNADINAESAPSDQSAPDNSSPDNEAPSFSVTAAEPAGDAGAPQSDAGASADAGSASEP